MKPPPQSSRLSRSFYRRPTLQVARELLGKALLRRVENRWVGGWIVETEAYLPEDDLASHSARGVTKSNGSMFERAGTLYVYPIHAKYCLNAVTEKKGAGCAVLIRAIEPVWGIERMKIHRGQDDLRKLTRGPAMLCQALAVTRDQDGLDLVQDRSITICRGKSAEPVSVVSSKRIGISQAADYPYRFFVADNRYVSGTRKQRQHVG